MKKSPGFSKVAGRVRSPLNRPAREMGMEGERIAWKFAISCYGAQGGTARRLKEHNPETDDASRDCLKSQTGNMMWRLDRSRAAPNQQE